MNHFEEDFPYFSNIDQTDGLTDTPKPEQTTQSNDTVKSFYAGSGYHVKLEDLKKANDPVDVEFQSIEPKKTTPSPIGIKEYFNISKISSWIFGVFFGFIGFIMMFSQPLMFLLFLAGLSIIPPINKIISEKTYNKFGFDMRSWKAVTAFVLLMAVSIGGGSGDSNQGNVAGASETRNQLVELEQKKDELTEAEQKLKEREERLARDEKENKIKEEEAVAKLARQQEEEAKKAEQEKAAAEQVEKERIAQEEEEKKQEAARIAAEQEAQRVAQEKQNQQQVQTVYSKPEPVQQPVSNCEPSYPDYCITVGSPDLDCKDIYAKNITVIGSDPHRLDGDSDGVGCES